MLQRVRETCLEAYDHQDLPFEKLVEELTPERRLNQTPLFQVMFAFQNAPASPVEKSALEISGFSLPPDTTRFDLTVAIGECRGDILGEAVYSKQLFDAVTVQGMIRSWATILREMVANPEERVDSVESMSDGERHRVLFDWNRTEVPYRSHARLNELFEQQVGMTPGAVAVEYEGGKADI